jgi:hypothetical protein
LFIIKEAASVGEKMTGSEAESEHVVKFLGELSLTDAEKETETRKHGGGE